MKLRGSFSCLLPRVARRGKNDGGNFQKQPYQSELNEDSKYKREQVW